MREHISDFISMYYMRRLGANENVPRFSRIEAKEQSCTRYEARVRGEDETVA